MSLRAMVAVFDRSDSELAARLVLLALAEYAHDDGSNAFPSIATVARKARVHPRTAQRALRELEDAGEITKTGTTARGVHVYHLNVVTPAGGDKLPPELLDDGSKDRVANRHPTTPVQDATPPRQTATLDDLLADPKAARWITNIGGAYAEDRETFREEALRALGAGSALAEELRQHLLERKDDA